MKGFGVPIAGWLAETSDTDKDVMHWIGGDFYRAGKKMRMSVNAV